MDISEKKRANREQLGAAIRAERERQGISLRKFAAMAGIDHAHLVGIEHGRMAVTIDTLTRIAESLDVAVRDLVDF